MRLGIITILTITILIFITLILFLFLQKPLTKKYKNIDIKINQTVFNVQIADNIFKRQLGLSNRDLIEPNKGMLFIFKHKLKPMFWMLKMHFPIDVLWILDDKILDISQNIQPPTITGSINTMKPSVKINKVLEINAGDVKLYNIKIGDTISTITHE